MNLIGYCSSAEQLIRL